MLSWPGDSHCATAVRQCQFDSRLAPVVVKGARRVRIVPPRPTQGAERMNKNDAAAAPAGGPIVPPEVSVAQAQANRGAAVELFEQAADFAIQEDLIPGFSAVVAWRTPQGG